MTASGICLYRCVTDGEDELMLAHSRQPIPAVIQQHAEESAILRHVRSSLVRAPHVKLHHLRRLDERLAAHLDGLAVAGDEGSRLCTGALETPCVGEVFAATVLAIEHKDSTRLDRLFALAATLPQARRGLTSAFGWVSAHDLKGIVAELLASRLSIRREIGIAACAMHRLDPGAMLTEACNDPDPSLRARAFRAAGELGRRDLRPACAQGLKDEDDLARFQAASSALLLGDRDRSLAVLEGFAANPNPCRARALRLWLTAVDAPSAHRLLKTIAQDPANRRLLIQGAGSAGDAHYIPWLIGQMADDRLARLAGESFSFVTGLDLADRDLERPPPEGLEPGPNDDPEDPDTAMDEDDGLPWPDAVKLQDWWDANQTGFPPGRRVFLGEPVSVGYCRQVLRDGFQRQRSAAAIVLSLLQPGTPLFPTHQPAWRQARLLGAGEWS